MEQKMLIPIKASEEEPPVANEYKTPPVKVSAWLLTNYGTMRYDFHRKEWATNHNDIFLNKDVTWYKPVSIDELLPGEKEIKFNPDYRLAIDEKEAFIRGALYIINHIKSKLTEK